MSTLKKDIVLDQEAFDAAIRDFSELSTKLDSLNNDVEQMLGTVKKGFDTPSGRQLVNLCETRLRQPLDAQKTVLQVISQTLASAKTSYQTAFNEYEELQQLIKNIK